MTEVRIAAIVEGHGECEAVPILIRRIALDIDPGFVPTVLKPLRIPASRLLKEGELERSVDLAVRKLQGAGGILIIVDCDWEGGCPARDGPALLERAVKVHPDIPVSVILAKKEYEAWCLASAESLQGKRGLPNMLVGPPDPEAIRGAKEWISDRMPQGISYSETDDQPAFTANFDMTSARRASSFDKCYRDIFAMLSKLWGSVEA
ncbi:MAG: DUF4276 family protein [Lentisphaerota bacterium]